MRRHHPGTELVGPPVELALGSLGVGEMDWVSGVRGRGLTAGLRRPWMWRSRTPFEARPACGSWIRPSVRAKVEPVPVHQVRLRQGPLTGDCPRTADFGCDAAGVCQLDEGRTVPGGVKPCISAPKIRQRRRNALSGPVAEINPHHGAIRQFNAAGPLGPA